MSKKVTEEELQILSTPDAELIESCQVWSFDCDEFRIRIKTGERWQQLLQSQIYLEHVVAQILHEAIAFPDEISFSRMPFGPRLDLARALDLLPSDIVAAIRRIAKMRNHVAHSLSFEIGESAVRDLENCTPTHLRQAVEMEKDRAPGPMQLHEMLEAIVIMVEIHRQQHVIDRLLSRKSSIRLRTVLYKTPGAKYVK